MKEKLKRILSPQYYKYIKKIVLSIHKCFYYPLVWIQYFRYQIILRKVRKKQRINVAFFVINRAVWKYDYLYRIMLEHPRFNPFIVVCPIVNHGKDHMLSIMDNTYTFFKNKGYKTIKTYDENTNTYLNVRKELDIDIIAYTNPYKGLIHDKYYISKFLDKLTIYVSYFFRSSTDQGYTKQPLINLVWTFFVESEFHKEYNRPHIPIRSKNAVVTGYLGADVFLEKRDIEGFDWKIKEGHLKKIIWAPHDSILDTDKPHFSCFFLYSDFMIEIAKKYCDKVQFVFKPHPLLRPKLVTLWGKKAVDSYYNKWANMPNTNFVDGEYIDLFLSSDAMIHDCDSFITEYMYTRKPVMRTEYGYNLEDEFHEFTLKCLDAYYHAYSKEDIIAFVESVIDGNDPKKGEREKYFENYLKPPYGDTASETAFNYLLTNLS